MEQELEQLLKLFDTPKPQHVEILRNSLQTCVKFALKISEAKLAKLIKKTTGNSIAPRTLGRFINQQNSRPQSSDKISIPKPESLQTIAQFLYEEQYIFVKDFTDHENLGTQLSNNLEQFFSTNQANTHSGYFGLFTNVISSQKTDQPIILFEVKQGESAGVLTIEESNFKSFNQLVEWEQQYDNWKEEAEKQFKRYQQNRYASVNKLQDEHSQVIKEPPLERLYGLIYFNNFDRFEIISRNKYKNHKYTLADTPTFTKDGEKQVVSFHLMDTSKPILNLMDPDSLFDNLIYFQRVEEFSSASIKEGFEQYQINKYRNKSKFSARRSERDKLSRIKGSAAQSTTEKVIRFKGVNTNPEILGKMLIDLAQNLVVMGIEQRPDIEPGMIEMVKLGGDIQQKSANGQTLLHILASVERGEQAKLARNKLMLLLIDKGIDLLALDNDGLLASSVALESGNVDYANNLFNKEKEQAARLGVSLPSQHS